MSVVHPEYKLAYDSLGDLSRTDAWPRRVNFMQDMFLKLDPEPIYRRSNWFWAAVGISESSELWQVITSAVTASPDQAEAHILGLPARLSPLTDTNATGKACAYYKRDNGGAKEVMDGTSIGTVTKERVARKWLSTQCKAVIEEITYEREHTFGGAGPRLRIMHAGISLQLAKGSDRPETQQSFDKRWEQWNDAKTKHIEGSIKRDVDKSRECVKNRARRTWIQTQIELDRMTAERERREAETRGREAVQGDISRDQEGTVGLEESKDHHGFESGEANLERETDERPRAAADTFKRDQEEAEDHELQLYFENEAAEAAEDERAWGIWRNDVIMDEGDGGGGVGEMGEEASQTT